MKKAAQHLSAADPVLRRIIARVGPAKLKRPLSPFQMLVRSIVFQQLSTKAAATIHGRLEAAAGGAITPESLLRLTMPQLRACGLSRQKASYVRDIAKHALAGRPDFEHIERLSDEEVITALTEINGVGEWTAHMFLIFALARPNVLATGDFGVRNAIRRAYKMRVLPKPVTIERLAKKKNWHPYCSFACWYLWRSLDNE
jgi:DNA-3-methyladenine glycosylase II